MAEIIPAIIPKNQEDLREKISLVKNLISVIQVDITDGIFVPEKSWPYNDEMCLLGVCICTPFDDIDGIEFDLMIKNPADDIGRWLKFKPKRIVLHVESFDSFGDLESLVEKIRLTVEVGLAFNFDTDINGYESLLGRVNFVQFMGIEKIGFQGQKFSEKVIKKINDFRSKYKNVTISVDGGVNLENASLLLDAGANRLVSGSAIYESDNLEEAINKFKKI